MGNISKIFQNHPKPEHPKTEGQICWKTCIPVDLWGLFLRWVQSCRKFRGTSWERRGWMSHCCRISYYKDFERLSCNSGPAFVTRHSKMSKKSLWPSPRFGFSVGLFFSEVDRRQENVSKFVLAENAGTLQTQLHQPGGGALVHATCDHLVPHVSFVWSFHLWWICHLKAGNTTTDVFCFVLVQVVQHLKRHNKHVPVGGRGATESDPSQRRWHPEAPGDPSGKGAQKKPREENNGGVLESTSCGARICSETVESCTIIYR